MMSTSTTRSPRVSREKPLKSNDSGKTSEPLLKNQATPEQIRLAQITSKVVEDPDLQSKIKQVMELTGKTSDEASVALHDCDNDPNRAIDMLLEGSNAQGEWETTSKKKKNRQLAQSSAAESNANSSINNNNSTNNKENRFRNDRGREREGIRNRPPPRLSKGRGRDFEKNEHNLENYRDRSSENRGGRGYRFMNGGGGGVGSRLLRGNRGNIGAARFRSFQSRGGQQSDFPPSIDTWSSVTTEANDTGETPMHVGNWSDKDGFPAAEDWDNEDWTGSLNETKVFTPSVSAAGPVAVEENEASLESDSETPLELQQDILSSSFSSGGLQLSSSMNLQFVSSREMSNNVAPSPPPSTSVSASSYSVLTSTTAVTENSPLKPSVALSSSPASSLSMTISNSLATSGMPSKILSIVNQQPTINSRPKSHRTKSLASSKIPSSAVEMPDDTIAALDVQFGSLDFGSEPTTINFSSVLDNSGSMPSDISSSSLTNHVNTLAGTQSLGNSVLHLTSTILGKPSNDIVGVDQSSHVTYQSAAASLGMSGSGVKDISHGGSASQSSMQEIADSSLTFVNQPDRKPTIPFVSQRVTQSTVLDGSLSANKMAENSSLSVYSVPSTNIVNHSNYQSGYGAHKSASSPYVHHHHSTSLPNSAPASQTSLYGASSFSSVMPSSSTYGVSQSTYAGPVAAVSTYVSGSNINQAAYGSHTLHSSMSASKLPSSLSSVKDSLESSSVHVYDMAHTTNSSNLTSALTTTASGVSSSLGLSSGSLSGANVNVTKSALSSSKTGVPSLPQGVPAVLGHQYIMGQAGLPFYSLQQPLYTYEDLQLLQQRMPPLASYYDVSFQPSTTLTGRDGGLANVAYSGTDAKFSRGDNASPVPTTLAQQQTSTQQHQQAFISPTALPPGYSYYYPSGVVASGFAQYGAPIFPMPPVSNAHAASTSSHFQKPNSYGSHGYTSGYDSLAQSQDFGKTGYGSSSQTQSKGLSAGSSGGSVNSVSANDLAASMYGKTHSQLNKQQQQQQQYDKPGFHAGTPPPFNMPGAQAGPMGAPSTAYAAAPFIPMMAQHQSPMLHHQLHQDSNTASQRPSASAVQNKVSTSSKPAYGASYWPSN